MLGRGEAANPPRVDRSVRRDPEAFDGDGPHLLPAEDDDRREHGGGDDTGQLRHRPLADRARGRSEGEDSRRRRRAVRRFVLLFDPDTTEPYALVPDGYLQRMRVGDTSGLGTKYVSREDAAVGPFGSGWQAGAQVLALDAVRNLDAVKVYSPTRGTASRSPPSSTTDSTPDFGP